MPTLPLLDSLIGGSKLLHLQRTYNWDMFMPFSMGGIPGEVLCKYCQDIKFGEYSMTDIASMRRGPYQSFYAGLFEVETVTMTFIKPVPDVLSAFFYGWKYMMVDTLGYYYPKSNYKKNIYVLLDDVTGIPFDRFKLEGVFPTKFPSYDLSYGTEDVVKVPIEFKVDRITKIDIVSSLSGLASWAGSLLTRKGGVATGPARAVLGGVFGI